MQQADSQRISFQQKERLLLSQAQEVRLSLHVVGVKMLMYIICDRRKIC